MLRIHQALQSNKYPNTVRLSRELEVSGKSIQRDLEFMRDRLNLPIEYDKSRFGYRYTQEVSAFPTVQITEGEIVALLVAEKALQQYRGTSFEKPLLSAIRKMEQSLPDTISLNLADVEQAISFRTRAEQNLNLEIFDALAKATAQRRQIEMAYRKPGRRETERRTVDPYHLANINGEWYLFAYDHGRKDIRTFVPVRMKSVKETGKIFSRPEKFSLEKRLSGSFGVYSGEGEFDVVIRFNARVADLIREKKWHESQRMREFKNGEVELQLKLSGLVEIERWVLGWGGDARVLKPRELFDAVRESAKKILRS